MTRLLGTPFVATMLVAASIGVGLGAGAPAGLSAGAPEGLGAEPPAEKLGDELASLAALYEIEAVVSAPAFPVATRHGQIAGKAAQGEALVSYLQLFLPEFRLYPAELVKRARLERIVFCQELSFAGQLRGAIPDYEHNTLYLDVRRGRHSSQYLRQAMHHEFFHLVDFRDDGLVYQDERWRVLNGPGFRYGDGGRFAQGRPTTSLVTERYPGFLTHYSTTGVEEDKAELFAHCVVAPEVVARRARSDAVLAAKVDMLRALLAEFCPQAGETFWKQIEKARQAESPTPHSAIGR